MMSVDLHQVEFLAREVATSLRKECHSSYERAGEAQTLFIRSGVEGTANVSLTTIEPGTLFWELSSGHRTDWLVKDQKDLEKMLCELKLMFAAVFTGSVTARGVLSAGDQKFRLAGPSSPLGWLRRVGTRYRPYADIG